MNKKQQQNFAKHTDQKLEHDKRKRKKEERELKEYKQFYSLRKRGVSQAKPYL